MSEKIQSEQIYIPEPQEIQSSFRAIFIGCLLGGLVAAMNIYFGLRTGWGIGGSLIAAILGYSFFQVLKPKTAFGVLETNIAQTTGSAAGSMTSAAGLVSAIPAMKMLGFELTLFELVFWSMSVAYLGVFFAIPLRKQMVVVEKLRFPTGTATAHTIKSMFAEGGDAMRKAKALFIWAITAAILTLAAFFIPAVGHPPIVEALGFSMLSALGFSLLISPMMTGAGILIGPKIGSSLFLGAILFWGLTAPYVMGQGWVGEQIMDYKTGARGWILWPAVALMVSDSLMTVVLSYKSIINTFKKVEVSDSDIQDHPEQIPTSWVMIGLLIGLTLVVTTSYLIFDIPPYMTVIAVILSALLSMIAVRSTGETDINPIGGMGKITQLVFGGIAPGSLSTNIMSAAITGSGASQAADMMQDLKTGYMLGASPKKQFTAQCWGIFAGMFFAVPIYKLFDAAYTIGEGDLPAPAAHAWRAMAEILIKGTEAMPTNSLGAVYLALIVGCVLSLLRKNEKIKDWIPSGLAMGIAGIVPAYYSVAMFFGSIIYVIWNKRNPSSAKALTFSVASGLIAGEGLMGVVTAVMTLLGIKPLF